jgi:hypothetical protein
VNLRDRLFGNDDDGEQQSLFENEDLDGCGLVHEYAKDNETTDEDIPWVVLFASVMNEGDEAIESRAAEWQELFGGASVA